MDIKDLIQEMPCNPGDLKICWSFIEALEDGREEIAAAILLQCSQETGHWVGVSTSSLDKKISSAKIGWQQWLKCMESANDWKVRNEMTLGIYGLFFKKPALPELPSNFPMGVPFFAESVATGFRHLIRSGLATINGNYIFPTPQLVVKIAQKYKKDTRACP